MIENGLNFFPKLLSFQKEPKVKPFGENWNWTAKDNAKSICQIKQYAQDIDPGVITKSLQNLM